MTTFLEFAQVVLEERDLAGIRGIDSERNRFKLHIAPANFAPMPLTSIRPRHVREWLREMSQKDANDTRGLRKITDQTIKRSLALVSSIATAAHEREEIEINFCIGVKVKKRADEQATKDKWTFLTMPEQDLTSADPVAACSRASDRDGLVIWTLALCAESPNAFVQFRRASPFRSVDFSGDAPVFSTSACTNVCREPPGLPEVTHEHARTHERSTDDARVQGVAEHGLALHAPKRLTLRGLWGSRDSRLRRVAAFVRDVPGARRVPAEPDALDRTQGQRRELRAWQREVGDSTRAASESSLHEIRRDRRRAPMHRSVGGAVGEWLCHHLATAEGRLGAEGCGVRHEPERGDTASSYAAGLYPVGVPRVREGLRRLQGAQPSCVRPVHAIKAGAGAAQARRPNVLLSRRSRTGTRPCSAGPCRKEGLT